MTSSVKMGSYYYDDPSGNVKPLSGKRGFCADGKGLYGWPIMLTSYIWEYLGHPLPKEIAQRYASGSGVAGSRDSH